MVSQQTTTKKTIHRWWLLALVALVWLPVEVSAQDEAMEAVERVQGEELDEEALRQAEEEGQVIRPDNLDPHERYDLPSNFDPGFRPRSAPGDTRVTIDFRDADLQEVVKFFAGVMNMNFIVADSLAADKNITIISPEEVTIDEAYLAFLSAMEMNGLTVVPHGPFLKILDSEDAISEPMAPFEVGDDIPVEARMVTAIIPVEHSDVEEIEEVISNFTSQHATIVRYHSNLIITENAANLNRLRALIRRLDEGEAASNLYVYRVQNADATEIQQQLEEIFGEGDDSQPTQDLSPRERRRLARERQQEGADSDDDRMGDVEITKMIADERTNQLIIMANDRSFERIREMIEILDVPTAVGGEVHVKFLEYANAEELSSTLSDLASGAQQQEDDARGAASLLQGDIQITSHDPTNSLVVIASPRDFVALEDVINELDRPQRQVYVEAVIMEISLDINRNFNIGAATGLSQDLDFLIPDRALDSDLIDSTRGVGLGTANFQGIEDLGGAGLGMGLLGPSVQLPGYDISLPAVALILQAAQTDNSVNVLSTPSILTLDNEEAEIVVGERIPIPRAVDSGGFGSLLGLGALGGGTGTNPTQQGQQQNLAGGALSGLGLGGIGGLLGGAGAFTPIDYEDIGIELRILPQINESDYVRLEVDQEVSDLKGAGGGSLDELGPTRTQRNAQTTVLVRDQSTIVIGGLIRDVENETTQKVPFLGDIPVVGNLFRSTSTLTTKQNLVLMLTPYIIESEQDMEKIYERKMEERRELARLFAQEELEYTATVNFNKKSGLMERIRREVHEAQTERQAREEALEEFEEHGPRYEILGISDRQREESPQEAPELPEEVQEEDLEPTNGEVIEADDQTLDDMAEELDEEESAVEEEDEANDGEDGDEGGQ